MATKQAFAVIAGVGPGTGAAIAKKFASLYSVVLLARSPASYENTAKEINEAGGTAIGFSVDVQDEASVKKAFDEAAQKFPDQSLAIAIYNVGGVFIRKPFLEQTVGDFKTGYEASVLGAFNFAQASLPYLLKTAKASHQHPPSLFFTGATGALKGSPYLQSFSPGKFAQRSLTMSLAKEFGPEGVHVSHLVVDGIIKTPKTAAWMKDAPEGSKIEPDAIAETYLALHKQPKTTWTWELDIRPFVEKW
ncbi:hypothetical protein H072_11533 [Dactylellina haptotyla CBS 200.50]|uniref:NAD(P)-binding protein n=1 Tax=Dactylellina haptotyla (strain CBS 200.50) TaxID=1284197 RepID=S8A1V6_DACHA|nr:hypothetical protein H072_11533 [Dactylellina haptotyla CBS 200.50]